MTLPASGAISMTMIREEFGGAAPDSISEYYRGGGLVPNTPQNAGIPTSGAISFADFYGSSALSVAISNRSVVGSTFEPNDASATYRLLNTGVAQEIEQGVTTNIPSEWLLGGSASDFEVRATLSSGTAPSGGDVLGSYLNLGTSRSWTQSLALASGVTGTRTCVLLVEIRPAGGGSVLDSASITITAQVTA